MADVGDLRFGRSGRKQEGVEGRTGRDLSPELCQTSSMNGLKFSGFVVLCV